MHWTAVEPGVTNWPDSRKPNWPGDRHVGIYASPDNWRTCLDFCYNLSRRGHIRYGVNSIWRQMVNIDGSKF